MDTKLRAVPVIRTLGENLVRRGLSGKPKRKAGLLCRRNYVVSGGASPDLRYSFSTSEKTVVKEVRIARRESWLFFWTRARRDDLEQKWDRHNCLSHRMLSLISRSMLMASFRSVDAASRGAERPALLEALAAKDRTSLCGPEGDSGFLTALGAGGLCFRAHL
jgi:hypothetical protein